MFFYLKPMPKIFLFVFLFAVSIYRRISFKNAGLIATLALITLIYYIQNLQFGKGSLYNYMSFVIIIMNAYMALAILKQKFIDYFIDVVYFFSFISLGFFILVNSFESFNQLVFNLGYILNLDPSGTHESFIIHAFEPNKSIGGLIRNNGGFWEPGVYATWTSLALLFNFIKTRNFRNIKSIILIIALLSTFSTAGYVALLLIILFYVRISKMNKNYKNIIIIISISLFTILFFNVEILGDKIIKQYTNAMEKDINEKTQGRFHSARKSIITIYRYPFAGKNLVMPRGEEIDSKSEEWGQYGILGLMSRVGLVVFFLFLLYLYKFFVRILILYKINKANALYGFFIVFVLLFSQALYETPIILMMIFIPMFKIKPCGNKISLETFNMIENTR